MGESSALLAPALIPFVFATLLCCAITFAICAIPFGLVVVHMLGKGDIRHKGSGNIGSTNVAREVGKGAAALTFLLDFGKGVLCVCLARWVLAAWFFNGSSLFLEPTFIWGSALCWVYLCCGLGHIFSPYLHFKGGKGIAVCCGAGMGLFWPVSAGSLALFIVLSTLTKRVSVGSVAAALIFPIFSWIAHFTPAALLPIAIASLVVLWAHRGNIKRLLNHNERAFYFHTDDNNQNSIPEKTPEEVERDHA